VTLIREEQVLQENVPRPAQFLEVDVRTCNGESHQKNLAVGIYNEETNMLSRQSSNSTPSAAGTPTRDFSASVTAPQRQLRQTMSFERKKGVRGRAEPTRALSFGRKPKSKHRSMSPSVSGEDNSSGNLVVEAPQGAITIEGWLWKRAALKFQKRWFFIQAGVLCYRESEEETNNIVCGQVTSVAISSAERYEFAIYTDQRQYDLRVETGTELKRWVDAGSLAAARWMDSY